MSALGRALMDFWGDNPRKRSYTATGWHAQVRKLTEHSRGSWAADQAGLDVKHRTLVDWLAERREPSPANQTRIRDAYNLLAGGEWDSGNERGTYRITGWVKTGDDERFRGIPSGPDKSATFKVDASSGKWHRIREAYKSGEIDEDKAEEWFIEDIIEEDDALNDGSPGTGWEFPGTSYTIS